MRVNGHGHHHKIKDMHPIYSIVYYFKQSNFAENHNFSIIWYLYFIIVTYIVLLGLIYIK